MYSHTQHDYDYFAKSASPTDCTGLIPEGPVDETELSTYQDVYHFGTKEMADVIEEDVIGKTHSSRL